MPSQILALLFCRSISNSTCSCTPEFEHGADEPGLVDATQDVAAERLEFFCQPIRCFELLHRQFGICMKMPEQRVEPAVISLDRGAELGCANRCIQNADRGNHVYR